MTGAILGVAPVFYLRAGADGVAYVRLAMSGCRLASASPWHFV